MCWTNDLEVKYRFYQQGEQRMCELRAIPEGEIRYTLDGSSPERSGIRYEGPFPVPSKTRTILAQAVADGLRSPVLQIDVPIDPIGPTVDPRKPALWRRRHKLDDTGTPIASSSRSSGTGRACAVSLRSLPGNSAGSS
ncbi:chitobiase/beta-hexosaminidase C-terminal domain-containing protein [Thermomicrobium sp. 4228-Ro]|uniref:FN3 associated domain-containing protein n=1 Tax=Thermomicrobium sp. 4228-Ro TaxID=2993937 RepID=UPI00224898BA|nr:FN3 associated domain-containing protein [Thermomicrobium sp. 4228-Ro]MCX2728279.1 chitobiase/beta-hexosaminidase C-terminal domain-containing protein [Thermomicrobium sp. 4228-Ro]